MRSPDPQARFTITSCHECATTSDTAARSAPSSRGDAGSGWVLPATTLESVTRLTASPRSSLHPAGSDALHEVALEEDVDDDDGDRGHDDDGHERRPVVGEAAGRSEEEEADGE